MLLFTAIRIFTAYRVDLFPDEGMNFVSGKHIGWCYTEHFPLTAWIYAVIIKVFGQSELALRMPAILIFCVISFFVYYFITSISYSKKIGLLAVLAINSGFYPGALALVTIPETILLVFLFPIIFIVSAVEKTNHLRYWVLLGLLLGLATLAKGPALFYLISISIYFGFRKRYDLLFSKNALLALVICFLFLSPILYWNIQHKFINISFGINRTLALAGLNMSSFKKSYLLQVITYNPLFYILSYYALIRGYFSSNPYIIIACFISTVFNLFFFISITLSKNSYALPHWMVTHFVLFIPLSIYFVLALKNKFFTWIVYFSVVSSLVLYIFVLGEVNFPFFFSSGLNNRINDAIGWKEIIYEAEKSLDQISTNKKAILVNKWIEGGVASYYSRKYPVFVIKTENNSFGIWQKNLPLGYDVLFIKELPNNEGNNSTAIPIIKDFKIQINSKNYKRVQFILYKDFKLYP